MPPKDPTVASPPKPKMLRLELLQPNPRNRRTTVDDEFVASIRQHGVLERLVVRPLPDDPGGPKYEIVCGHRRWLGAQQAELAEVPVDIREMSDATAMEIAIVENLQRKSLTALEEADAFRWLIEEQGRSVSDVAARVARSEAYVRQRLHLHGLVPLLRTLLDEDVLTMDAALLLAQTPPGVQEKIAAEAERRLGYGDEDAKRVTRSDAADWISGHWNQLREAPFDVGDAGLVETAGACGTCPKRTGTQGVLFEIVEVSDACLDKECWRSKCDATWSRRVDDAKKRGLRVLTDDEVRKIAPHGAVSDPRAGWVGLDDRAYNDGPMDAPKWRDVIGDDVPRAIGRTQAGTVVELADREAALRTAKKLAKESGDKQLGKAVRQEAGADKARETISKNEKQRRADVVEGARKEAARKEADLVEIIERAKALDLASSSVMVDLALKRIVATFAQSAVTADAQRFVKRRGVPCEDGYGGAIPAQDGIARWTSATNLSRGALVAALAELAILAHDRIGDARPDFLADLPASAAVKRRKPEAAPKAKKKPGKLTNAAAKKAGKR
jgi:ParB/RepB/Spo0J family partition protein